MNSYKYLGGAAQTDLKQTNKHLHPLRDPTGKEPGLVKIVGNAKKKAKIFFFVLKKAVAVFVCVQGCMF